MTDAFEFLARDHAEVKQMLSQLEMGPAGEYAATNDQLPLRKKLVEQLVTEESKHEAVEEMYFWPAVRRALTDGDKLAEMAVSQEDEGKQVLDRLGKLDAVDPEFERLLADFIHAAREHIDYEETLVWPRLRNTLTVEEAEELGGKMKSGKKTAPTRPHPRTPSGPAAVKATGPIAAVADKVRDRISGRGGPQA